MIRAAALFACLLLAACGQKGNLYLPDQAKPVKVPAKPMASPVPPATANDAGAGTTDETQRQRQQQQQQAAPGSDTAGK